MAERSPLISDLPSSPFAAAAEVARRMREEGFPEEVVSVFRRDVDCSSVETVTAFAEQVSTGEVTEVSTMTGEVVRTDHLPPATYEDEDEEDDYDDLI